VVYRLEPESVPFDISPFAGDIFAQESLKNGRYEFEVVAEDSDQQARVILLIYILTKNFLGESGFNQSERRQE
jgi:hypothetical protein